MKLKVTMFVVLVCLGQMIAVFGQTNPESFTVKFISIDADPVPRFVWRYSNTIISWHKESNAGEVSCLKKDLLKTGLFSEVEPQLYQIKESDEYELVLALKYTSPDPVYKVSEIKFSGFDEVNEAKFRELLAAENLLEKSLSLKKNYLDFEDKIIELARKSIADETKKDEFKSPWFELTLNKNQELEVTVTPGFKGCANVSK